MRLPHLLHSYGNDSEMSGKMSRGEYTHRPHASLAAGHEMRSQDKPRANVPPNVVLSCRKMSRWNTPDHSVSRSDTSPQARAGLSGDMNR